MWTFVSGNGRDILHKWAADIGLPTKVRALLDQKLQVLRQQPIELVIHTHLLAGPIVKHIYKLRVNGTIAVRLMLCKGPIHDVGYTILLGATERDGRLDPGDAPARAMEHRAMVIANPEKRRRPYEPLGRQTAG